MKSFIRTLFNLGYSWKNYQMQWYIAPGYSNRLITLPELEQFRPEGRIFLVCARYLSF